MEFNRITSNESVEAKYFTASEVTRQLGAGEHQWLVRVVKELVDNALDASEVNAHPIIEIDVNEHSVAIADNGPGMPVDIIKQTLDYKTHTSSNRDYRGITRGALGNGLLAFYASCYVHNLGEWTDDVAVSVEYETQGQRVKIEVKPTVLSSEPEIIVSVSDCENENGTRITFRWVDAVKTLDEVKSLLEQYAWFNPHASILLTCDGYQEELWESSQDISKWTANRKTSIFWYKDRELLKLMQSYHAHDPAIVLTKFLGIFDQFSPKSQTTKNVLLDLGLEASARPKLRDVMERWEEIYQVMLDHCKAPSSKSLGVIDVGADKRSTHYKRVEGKESNFVVECWAWIGDEGSRLEIAWGLNFSPLYKSPVSNLKDELFTTNLLDVNSPIQMCVHIVMPNPPWLSSSKANFATYQVPELEDALREVFRVCLRDWVKIAKQLKRNQKASQRQLEAASKVRKLTYREALELVIESAYESVSSGGQFGVIMRQLFYACRPLMEPLMKGDVQYGTFCNAVHEFMDDNSEGIAKEWRVLADARGHFITPNGYAFGIGSVATETFLDGWRSPSIHNRYHVSSPVSLHGETEYGAVLYLEKEGFYELLQYHGIPQRYGLAMFSSKGLPSVACRKLVDALAGKGLKVLCMHDLDPQGMNILHLMNSSNNRYDFVNEFDVIDVGLRLSDVQEYNLRTESFKCGTTAEKLAEYGCTPEEVELLRSGQRCEINALTTEQFIELVERRLQEAGVRRVVPGDELLAQLYVQSQVQQQCQKAVDKLTLGGVSYVEAPGDLSCQVREWMNSNPESDWVKAVQALAKGHVKG